MKELLPCPHCGETPSLFFGRTSGECWAYVSCECGAQTKNAHGETDRDAAKIAANVWNRRVDHD